MADFKNYNSFPSSNPSLGQVATSGLCYLMCEEVPGIENVGTSIIKGHEVYKYRMSLSKKVVPGYNGHLNASAKVIVSTLDVIMDHSCSELFQEDIYGGTIYKKLTVTNLKNFGDGNMAKPSFSIELTNAKLTFLKSNVKEELGGYRAESNPSVLSGFNSNAAQFAQQNDPYFNPSSVTALHAQFLADQLTWIYYPVEDDATASGNVSTSYNVLKNNTDAPAA